MSNARKHFSIRKFPLMFALCTWAWKLLHPKFTFKRASTKPLANSGYTMAGIKARNTLDSSISSVDFLLMRLLFMLSNLDNISCICITITCFQMQLYTFSYLVWQPTLQLHGYCALSVASPATALWSFD